MKPRLVDRLLDIHLEIDHIHDHLQHRVDDRPAAGTSGRKRDFAILQHDRGSHRGQRPLLRCNGICFALNQTVCVWHARFRREVVHLVVEQKSGSWNRNGRTVAFVEGVRAGDDVAVGIDDREMRCLR